MNKILLTFAALFFALPVYAGSLNGGILSGGSQSVQSNVIYGTNTNDNAPAGVVGEYIASNVAFGSAVSLTSGVAADITTIELTAGDWDVSGWCGYLTAGTTTVSYIGCSVSTASATFQGPSDIASRVDYAWTFATGSDPSITLPTIRKSLASTTTLYLVSSSIFAVSTNGGFGFIRARRVR